MYTEHYAVFSEGRYYLYFIRRSIFRGGYYLYYEVRSIFAGWILFILFTTQYFRSVDTIFYNLLFRIFEGWIQFTLCITQYFWRVDTIYTIHYVVF